MYLRGDRNNFLKFILCSLTVSDNFSQLFRNLDKHKRLKKVGKIGKKKKKTKVEVLGKSKVN